MTTFWFIIGLGMGLWSSHVIGAGTWGIALIVTLMLFFCMKVDKNLHKLLMVNKKLIANKDLSANLKSLEEMLRGQPTPAPVSQGCPLPPAGWYCTRVKGHEGPCAALPVTERHGHLKSCEWHWGDNPKEHSPECVAWQESKRSDDAK